MAEKAKVCNKVFILSGGEETNNATPDAEAVVFRFVNGNNHTVHLEDFPEHIRNALMWHGISAKLGDVYAGSKGDADLAEETFLTAYERLVGGDWMKAREGVGARPSLVVEAIVAALEKAGEEVSDARREAIREKCKDKATRDAAIEDPAIKVEYERIKLDRQKEREKAAREAAKGKTSNLGGLGF